jgi:DNA-binding CsgD family transcriptional regulator
MKRAVFPSIQQTPVSYLGMTFTIAWVYVTFYTSALSPQNPLDIQTINIYRACNLVASLGAFLLLIILQKRFGEVSLRPQVQIASAVITTLSTLVAAFVPADSIGGLIIGIIACALSSICSTIMYVAWGHFYGLPFNRSSKIILPLASALAMALSLICLFLTGPGLSIIASLLPLLSLTFYQKALIDSPPPDADVNTDTDAKKALEETSGNFPWRIAIILAIFWFIFTFMNVDITHSNPIGHETLYGWGFACGLAGSLFVAWQFTHFNRHTTFATVFKAAIPLLLLAVVLFLLFPSQSFIVVHSICLMAMTIFNAHLLVFGAVFVRKNMLTATTSYAGMRIFASAGEGLAIIVFYLIASRLNILMLTFAFILMFAILVCALLAAMTDTNIDNFHNKHRDKTLIRIDTDLEGNSPSVNQELKDRNEAMETFEHICNEIGKTYELSAREIEVIILYGRGRDLPYICEHLYISKPTVNTHVRHIFEKIGIHSKQELLDLLENQNSDR